MRVPVTKQLVVDGKPTGYPFVRHNLTVIDLNQPLLYHRLHSSLGAITTIIRKTAPSRSRTTIRKRMVRRHRDMLGHDHIPR